MTSEKNRVADDRRIVPPASNQPAATIHHQYSWSIAYRKFAF